VNSNQYKNKHCHPISHAVKRQQKALINKFSSALSISETSREEAYVISISLIRYTSYMVILKCQYKVVKHFVREIDTLLTDHKAAIAALPERVRENTVNAGFSRRLSVFQHAFTG